LVVLETIIEVEVEVRKGGGNPWVTGTPTPPSKQAFGAPPEHINGALVFNCTIFNVFLLSSGFFVSSSLYT